MQPNEIALLIMAGGVSRRFGEDDKLLSRLNGVSLGLHTAKRLAAMPWAEKRAVAWPSLSVPLASLGFDVFEPRLGNGLGDNIALGAKGLGNVKGVVIALADMPFVPSSHFQRILDAANSSQSVVWTKSRELRSPPVFVGANYFSLLRASRGDKGAKAILADAGSELTDLIVESKAVRDIDTCEDLRMAKRSSGE